MSEEQKNNYIDSIVGQTEIEGTTDYQGENMATGGRVGYQTGGISMTNTAAQNRAINNAQRGMNKANMATARARNKQQNFVKNMFNVATGSGAHERATREYLNPFKGGKTYDTAYLQKNNPEVVDYMSSYLKNYINPKNQAGGKFGQSGVMSVTGLGRSPNIFTKQGMSEAAKSSSDPSFQAENLFGQGTLKKTPTGYDYTGGKFDFNFEPGTMMSGVEKYLLRPSEYKLSFDKDFNPITQTTTPTPDAGTGGQPNYDNSSKIYDMIGGEELYKSPDGYEIKNKDGQFTALGGKGESLEDFLSRGGITEGSLLNYQRPTMADVAGPNTSLLKGPENLKNYPGATDRIEVWNPIEKTWTSIGMDSPENRAIAASRRADIAAKLGGEQGRKYLEQYADEQKEGESKLITSADYPENYKGAMLFNQGGKVKLMGGAMPMGIMRTNKAGVMERDYRDKGGFVPVGIKEKADDVPAMLSKNEFVMTANAVRGAGNGSIEKGAQRMYDTMKRLEKRVR